MAPSSASPDVIVIGGGVIGASTAYFLSAEHNLRCLVLERDGIASGASGGAAGELGAVGRHQFSEPYTRFLLKGIEMHSSLAPTLLEESGIDYLLSDIPMIRPAFDEQETAELRSAMEWQRSAGMDVEWLDADVLHGLGSWLTTDAVGAAYTVEKQLEAYSFALALAQAAERHRVEFRTSEVTEVLRSGSTVTGVRSGNDTYHAGAVVVANGPWVKQSSAWLGMDVPVIPLRGQIIHVGLPPDMEMPEHAIFHETGYLLPKAGGGLMVGTTQEDVGFDSSITADARDSILEGVIRLAPALVDAPIKDHTACLRPYSLDELPIIGAVPGSESLYIATGHAFKGVTLALITGKYLAQLMVRGVSDLPLDEFSPNRFLDNSAR
ncbi:MAG: FAD-dependent oxidoreductase [Dehalococcoidia bacterium]